MELIDLKKKNYFSEVELSESELSDIILQNWSTIFPNLELIQKEFLLTGEVRDKFTGGRIDFFAYNRARRSFVIIEIKSIYDKNIRSQIFDYADSVEDNYSLVLLRAKQRIPDIIIANKSIELILFAKFFKTNDYERIKKIEYPTKLITYRFFKNNNILLDQIDNTVQIKTLTNKKYLIEQPEETDKEDEGIIEFWHSFFDMQNRQILLQNEDYRIEGPELILRLSSTHQKYANECLSKGLNYMPVNYLRKQLKRSTTFIRYVRSVRFSNVVSSAYYLDYGKIKSIIGK